MNNPDENISQKPFKLSWKNLNVSLKIKPSIKERVFKKEKGTTIKRILTDVNGDALSNSMLAIMGASGSGKTTLLNVLFGAKSENMKISGTILVNSQPINIKSISAYVEQSDLFISVLTVREHLLFYGKLVLGDKLKQNELNNRIDEILMRFGLEKCKDSQIGSSDTKKGISGGECRRLSIASQVMSNPRIIFLDEPTSGLDSFTAETVIGILRDLAMRNCAIITTIHQPSSKIFQLFDRLLLLAEGKVIYSGNNKDCLEFFQRAGFYCPQNYNPADFYIETIALKQGKYEEFQQNVNKLLEMRKIYEKESDKVDEITDEVIVTSDNRILKRKKANFFNQFQALMSRSWKTISRDRLLFRARILQVLFIGILFGLVYLRLENNQFNIMNFQGAIFSIITNLSFGGAIGVVFVLPYELSVFKREHGKLLYDTLPYFITKSIADIPIFILIPTILIFITYFMIGFVLSWQVFFTFWLIGILANQCAVSYGYFIASISKDMAIATTIVGPMLMPMMLFGGLYIKTNAIPSYFVWISYISWFRYSFDALMEAQYGGRNVECVEESLTCPGGVGSVSGEQIMKMIGLSNNGLLINVLALLGLTVGYKILALLIIISKTRFNERMVKLKK